MNENLLSLLEEYYESDGEKEIHQNDISKLEYSDLRFAYDFLKDQKKVDAMVDVKIKMNELRNNKENENYQPENTLTFLNKLERNLKFHKRFNSKIIIERTIKDRFPERDKIKKMETLVRIFKNYYQFQKVVQQHKQYIEKVLELNSREKTLDEVLEWSGDQKDPMWS